jgi:hypothetical protein
MTLIVAPPPHDVIFAHLACPPNAIIICTHGGITNPSLYKHCKNTLQPTLSTDNLLYINRYVHVSTTLKKIARWSKSTPAIETLFLHLVYFIDFYLINNSFRLICTGKVFCKTVGCFVARKCLTYLPWLPWAIWPKLARAAESGIFVAQNWWQFHELTLPVEIQLK